MRQADVSRPRLNYPCNCDQSNPALVHPGDANALIHEDVPYRRTFVSPERIIDQLNRSCSVRVFPRRYSQQYRIALRISLSSPCNNSGSLAIFTAIRRASSLLSSFAADVGPAHPRNRDRRVAGRCGRARQSRHLVPRQSKAAENGDVPLGCGFISSRNATLRHQNRDR